MSIARNVLENIKKIGLGNKEDGLVPNILITNHCNQHCSFCFAQNLMSQPKVGKEMKFSEYKKLISDIKKQKIEVVYLMGGEPTLHSNFKKILEYTRKEGLEVELFTNALMDESMKEYLLKNASMVKNFHINITTPSMAVKKRRMEVAEYAKKLSVESAVSLEMTVSMESPTYYLRILDDLNSVLPKSALRIGVDGYFLNKLNGKSWDIEKNRRIGGVVEKLIEASIEKGVRGVWLTEIYRCMFADKEIIEMEKSGKVNISGYGCLSKRGSVDIRTDMKAIRCFSFRPLEGEEMEKGIREVKKKLDREMEKESRGKISEVCQKCKYWGYSKGKCPGPCLVKI